MSDFIDLDKRVAVLEAGMEKFIRSRQNPAMAFHHGCEAVIFFIKKHGTMRIFCKKYPEQGIYKYIIYDIL